MGRICVAILVVTLTIASSKTLYAQKTPLEMNDRIVSVTDSLFQLGQDWGNVANEAVKTADYTILKTKRLALENYIARETAKLKVLKDLKGSKELREITIAFLEFEKKIAMEGMRPFETLTATTSQEDVVNIVEKFKTLTADENKYLEKVSAAQDAYAKANGFTIETGEEATSDN